MAVDRPLDPDEAFAELGRIKHDTGLEPWLRQVAGLAKRAVPGADGVSVTLVRGRKPSTAASTGALALALDEQQYRSGAGPCLDAAAGPTVISAPDLSLEKRWPEYLRYARDAGVGSALSIGLPVPQNTTGALNLYALEPGAFDADAAELGWAFAGYAAVALAHAHLLEATTALDQHLRTALEHRATLDPARGGVVSESDGTSTRRTRPRIHRTLGYSHSGNRRVKPSHRSSSVKQRRGPGRSSYPGQTRPSAQSPRWRHCARCRIYGRTWGRSQ